MSGLMSNYKRKHQPKSALEPFSRVIFQISEQKFEARDDKLDILVMLKQT